MARFRLRFLLQEFDLAPPEVIVGRSPDCQITLEDPLVSRRHAAIRVKGESAFVVDLGSRNGVRVNGEIIDDNVELSDGDRIRLGTQDLVFSIVKHESRKARPTGYLRFCSRCGTPYPEEAAQCPHCGHSEVDETLSGVVDDWANSWTFQLLGEVIERAVVSSRPTEADRIMTRAAREADVRIEAGERLDLAQIVVLSTCALRLAGVLEKVEWAKWALSVHHRQSVFPTGSVLEVLEELKEKNVDGLADAIGEFLKRWNESHPDEEHDLAPLERLASL